MPKLSPPIESFPKRISFYLHISLYLSALVIRRESAKVLEDGQTLNDIIGGSALEDAITVGDVEAGESAARVTESTDGLAVAESVEQDLAGAAGRVEGRGGVARDEVGGVGADEDGIEVGGVGSSVGGVDAGGEGLGDDDGVDVLVGQSSLDGVDVGVVGGVGSQDADLKAIEARQTVRVGADAGRSVVVVVGRVCVRSGQAKGSGDTCGNVMADAVQLDEDVVLDDVGFELGSLEANGVDQELLLDLGQAVVEETRLRPDIVEGVGNGADKLARGLAVGITEVTTALLPGSLLGL